MSPVLDQIVNQIASFLASIVQEALSRLTTSIAYAFEQLRDFIAVPIQTGLNTVYHMVAAFARDVSARLSEGLSGLASTVYGWLKELYTSMTEGLRKVQAGFDLVKGLVIETGNTLVTHFNKVSETLTNLIANTLTAIAGKISELGNTLKDVINGGIDFLRGVGEKIFDVVTNLALLLKEFFEKLVSTLTQMLEFMKSLVELKPDEVVAVVTEVQKALLGLRPR